MSAPFVALLVALGATAGWAVAGLLTLRRRARSDMEKWEAFCRAMERPEA